MHRHSLTTQLNADSLWENTSKRSSKRLLFYSAANFLARRVLLTSLTAMYRMVKPESVLHGEKVNISSFDENFEIGAWPKSVVRWRVLTLTDVDMLKYV